jgi:hypothetical protein
MRAVRFCATREFALDPATLHAIAPTLPVLARVSRERVLVELTKLLEARQPSLGLVPMAETGMWPLVLPEPEGAARREAIASVDTLPPRLAVRLARLLLPVAHAGDRAAVEAGLDNLKPSRQLRATVLALVSPRADALAAAATDPDRRRAAAALGREHVEDTMRIRGVDPAATLAAIAGAPLVPRELAVKGGDLITAGIVPRGPQVSEAMNALLDWVHEDPTRNEREALLARARATMGA